MLVGDVLHLVYVEHDHDVLAPHRRAPDLDEENRSSLEADPAARNEVGKRLVHRFTGGAHEVGKLFLREVVGDVDAFGSPLSEAIGQIDERLGDAAGDVGKDQIGHLLVRVAQTTGQLSKHGYGHVGMLVDEVHHVFMGQGDQAGGRDRGDRRGTGAEVEQREFADDLTRAENGDEILAAVVGRVAELDFAVGDYV